MSLSKFHRKTNVEQFRERSITSGEMLLIGEFGCRLSMVKILQVLIKRTIVKTYLNWCILFTFCTVYLIKMSRGSSTVLQACLKCLLFGDTDGKFCICLLHGWLGDAAMIFVLLWNCFYILFEKNLTKTKFMIILYMYWVRFKAW